MRLTSPSRSELALRGSVLQRLRGLQGLVSLALKGSVLLRLRGLQGLQRLGPLVAIG
jgi:hypothetical protein